MFLLKELPDKKNLKKVAKDTKGVDPTSASFMLQFLKTSSDIMLCIDRFFAEKGLSQGRFLALMVLADADENGLYPYEIAESMGISRATASGLLKGLESSEYVASKQSETDGRMKSITLTDSGRQKVEELTPEYYKLVSSFPVDLDKKGLKKFGSVLSDLSLSLIEKA